MQNTLEGHTKSVITNLISPEEYTPKFVPHRTASRRIDGLIMTVREKSTHQRRTRRRIKSRRDEFVLSARITSSVFLLATSNYVPAAAYNAVSASDEGPVSAFDSGEWIESLRSTKGRATSPSRVIILSWGEEGIIIFSWREEGKERE